MEKAFFKKKQLFPCGGRIYIKIFLESSLVPMSKSFRMCILFLMQKFQFWEHAQGTIMILKVWEESKNSTVGWADLGRAIQWDSKQPFKLIL